jgi:spore maturation protein CgeB
MKKRLLHIMMGKHNPNMQIGLNSVFECMHLDWMDGFEEDKSPTPAVDERTVDLRRVHGFNPRNPSGEIRSERPSIVSTPENFGPTDFDEKLMKAFNSFKPHIVFIHTQRGGVISVDAAAEMRKSAIVVNFTGDVRYPIPQFYKSFGKEIDMTLFTNMEDVNNFKRQLIPCEFLQVGFDSKRFSPDGPVNKKTPEIVFMGSNYGRTFPLSEYRELMVRTLREVFKDKIGIYGANWNELGDGSINSYEEEGAAYRGCKVAISLSHFNRGKYASDRLFRILGSGAFCLTHDYPGLGEDFEVGEDLDTFVDVNDLVYKIKYYLEHDQERETIAYNGCQKARLNFTWHNFAENLKSITNNIKK